MTLISQIITEGYRESNNIAVGDTPNVAEQAEGLNLLNRIVSAMTGTDAGDLFTNFFVGNNNVNTVTKVNPDFFAPGYTPPVNTRIVFNNQQKQTVYMNPSPQDGERFAVSDASNNFSIYSVTLIGNGATIEGASSKILSISGTDFEYFYNAYSANWARVSPLTLTSIFPFPNDFEDLFIIGLAIRLNPRNGTSLDPQSAATYADLKKKFKARYSIKRVPVGSEFGLTQLPSNKLYNRGTFYNYPDRFNLGY